MCLQCSHRVGEGNFTVNLFLVTSLYSDSPRIIFSAELHNYGVTESKSFRKLVK